jgi:hypothetical protein
MCHLRVICGEMASRSRRRQQLRLEDCDQEMDSFIEDVAENDEIGQYVDLSRFNRRMD